MISSSEKTSYHTYFQDELILLCVNCKVHSLSVLNHLNGLIIMQHQCPSQVKFEL